jgi:hypothetical protein
VNQREWEGPGSSRSSRSSRIAGESCGMLCRVGPVGERCSKSLVPAYSLRLPSRTTRECSNRRFKFSNSWNSWNSSNFPARPNRVHSRPSAVLLNPAPRPLPPQTQTPNSDSLMATKLVYIVKDHRRHRRQGQGSSLSSPATVLTVGRTAWRIPGTGWPLYDNGT